jgi:hypothetical protein
MSDFMMIRQGSGKQQEDLSDSDDEDLAKKGKALLQRALSTSEKGGIKIQRKATLNGARKA